MELHFIILIVLSAIVLVLFILIVCVYCCGGACQCGDSTYSHSHSREAYSNKTVTSGGKTSSQGEYHSEHYSNSDQTLPSSMPLPESQFETDDHHSTPLLIKDPPKPKSLGFAYPVQTPQAEVTTSYSNGAYYPPSETVATVSYPASQRTPYVQDPGDTKTAHRVESISYAPYPTQTYSSVAETNEISRPVTVNSRHVAHAAPLPAINTSYSSDSQMSKTATVSYPVSQRTHPRDQGVTEISHHVETNSYAPHPATKEMHFSDLETNEMLRPVSTKSRQIAHAAPLPTKDSQTSKTVTVSYSASNGASYPRDPEVNTDTSRYIETSPYAPHSPTKQIYVSDIETNKISYPPANNSHHFTNTQSLPSKNRSYLSDSQTNEYFINSESRTSSNVATSESRSESISRNFYTPEPPKNQTQSTRTITYSSENATCPRSIRLAEQLLPSSDVFDQSETIQTPFRKHPSEVSLYDNM